MNPSKNGDEHMWVAQKDGYFLFDQPHPLCYRAKRLSMIKRKQSKKIINDQKETLQKDYQLSKGNRTQRLSIIKRKQNNKTINDRHSTTEETKAWKT